MEVGSWKNWKYTSFYHIRRIFESSAAFGNHPYSVRFWSLRSVCGVPGTDCLKAGWPSLEPNTTIYRVSSHLLISSSSDVNFVISIYLPVTFFAAWEHIHGNNLALFGTIFTHSLKPIWTFITHRSYLVECLLVLFALPHWICIFVYDFHSILIG